MLSSEQVCKQLFVINGAAFTETHKQDCVVKMSKPTDNNRIVSLTFRKAVQPPMIVAHFEAIYIFLLGLLFKS